MEPQSSNRRSACYRIAVNHWSPDSALAEMVRLGGSDKYKGLNRSVMGFKPPTKQGLAEHLFDPNKAPEAAPFVERMSGVDHLFDELKRFEEDTTEFKGNALALEEIFAEIHRLKACVRIATARPLRICWKCPTVSSRCGIEG